MDNSIDSSTSSELVKCPGCAREVGLTVDIDGLPWLNVNGIAVRAMHGVCLQCGQEFHWSISEQALAALISKVLGMRNGNM